MPNPPDTAFTAVVALDGPSGTGKSTVARRLAVRVGGRYLDTGAMYRAVTAMVLRAGVDPSDPAAVLAATEGLEVDISTDPGVHTVRVAGIDLTDEIRTPEVTVAVSPVSAVPEVRAALVAQQRALIGTGAIVVEGRDIASVVWPQAELKVYLTASPEVRAARRAGELADAAVGSGSASAPIAGAPSADALAAVAADLARRDRYDSTRAASPLARADGALELDTSELDIDGVVGALLHLLAAAGS